MELRLALTIDKETILDSIVPLEQQRKHVQSKLESYRKFKFTQLFKPSSAIEFMEMSNGDLPSEFA